MKMAAIPAYTAHTTTMAVKRWVSQNKAMMPKVATMTARARAEPPIASAIRTHAVLNRNTLPLEFLPCPFFLIQPGSRSIKPSL